MRGDTEVWSARHPFTLWEAGVTDDGTVAGYAYTRGWRGFPEKPGGEWNGDFHVVIFDPAGGIRLNDVTKRAHSRFLHTPPSPLALGLLVHPETDRVIVRLSDPDVNACDEEWRIHRLSTGELLSASHPKRLIPDSEPLRGSMQLRAVRGTPLTLVQWWRFDSKGEPRALGTRFDLLNEKGAPVWTLDLPNDYTVLSDSQAGWAILEGIRDRGGFLPSDQPNQFDLHLVADGQRATFSVHPDGAAPTGWRVERTGSRPIDAPGSAKPPAAPTPVEITLKHLGDIDLGRGAEPPPVVRNVLDFDIDDQGRIGFLRRADGNGPAVLVLMTQTQQLLKEVEVAGSDDDGVAQVDLAWAGGNQWAIAQQSYVRAPGSDDARSVIRTTLLDVDSGAVRPVVGLDEGSIDSLKTRPGGGFCALVKQHVPYTINTRIAIFDGSGASLYDTTRSGYTGGSADAIAVTSDGHIARLDTVSERVDIHDLKDRAVASFKLRACWGREPNYPSEVDADVDGGFIVEDFNGSPSLIRMRRDGTVAASFDPRFSDGRVITPHNGVVVAPDQSLWVSDGDAILRLGEDGVVTQALGKPPGEGTLRTIDEVCFDGAGSIYVLDKRGGRIHVFDGQGAPFRAFGPEGSDFGSGITFGNLSVAHDGTVQLAVERAIPTGDIVRFGPTGTRLSPVQLDLDPVTMTWIRKPRQPGGWVMGYHDLHLVDDNGVSQRRISRRPDGRFLERIGSGAVAPDGSIAVAVSQLARYVGAAICLFDPTGEPRAQFETSGDSFHELACDGRNIYATRDERILIFGDPGSPPRSFTPPSVNGLDAYWHVAVSPDGRELLLWEHGSTRLHRYATPDAAAP